MQLSQGKIKHLNALSNHNGVIAAAAMDQRGSLRKAIAGAKGVPEKQVNDDMMTEFKVAVTKILTPHASAILLDPEFGLPAAKARAQKRRSAARLRRKRVRQHQARPPARSASAPLRQSHQRVRRGRRQDPDLLHAFRDTRR